MEDVAKHPRLIRRGAVYHFRAKVPVDLREVYAPKVEITFSLRTKDHREALERVRLKSVELDQEFAAHRARLSAEPKTQIGDTEIERLAALHLHQMLEEDDDFRTFGSGEATLFTSVANQVASAGGAAYWKPEDVTTGCGLTEREFCKDQQGTQLVLEDARRRLARGDTSLLSFEIDDLLDRNNVRIEPSSPEYRRVSLAILRAHVRGLEALTQRAQGHVVETPAQPPSLQSADQLAMGSEKAPALSKAYEEWKAAHTGPEKTAQAFKTSVDRFISLHGDLPVTAIAKTHVRRFRDEMLKYPRNLTNAMRKMSVAEAIASIDGAEDVPTLSPSTVNDKMLAGLSAVLAFCDKQAGYIDANPCAGIRAKEDRDAEPPRVTYTDNDIGMILRFPIFAAGQRPTGCGGEAAIWLPLLAMFTGARLEELAQLTADCQSARNIAP